MRIGIGYDVHKLVDNKDLILGGVKIDYDKGLLGHSDADVLLHAIIDSILGALVLGDIGSNFPDTDKKYKDISSKILLENVYNKMNELKYTIGNVDCTIVAQKPKVSQYINQMRKNIANSLHCDISKISVKATTTEKLGFEGRKEGISAHSVCLLIKK